MYCKLLTLVCSVLLVLFCVSREETKFKNCCEKLYLSNLPSLESFMKTVSCDPSRNIFENCFERETILKPKHLLLVENKYNPVHLMRNQRKNKTNIFLSPDLNQLETTYLHKRFHKIALTEFQKCRVQDEYSHFKTLNFFMFNEGINYISDLLNKRPQSQNRSKLYYLNNSYFGHHVEQINTRYKPNETEFTQKEIIRKYKFKKQALKPPSRKLLMYIDLDNDNTFRYKTNNRLANLKFDGSSLVNYPQIEHSYHGYGLSEEDDSKGDEEEGEGEEGQGEGEEEDEEGEGEDDEGEGDDETEKKEAEVEYFQGQDTEPDDLPSEEDRTPADVPDETPSEAVPCVFRGCNTFTFVYMFVIHIYALFI